MLSRETLGVIADIAGRDAERVFTSAGIPLVHVPPIHEGGTTIFPGPRMRVNRTLLGLDLSEQSILQSVLRAVAELAELYAVAPKADRRKLVRLVRLLEKDGFTLKAAGDPLAAIQGLAASAVSLRDSSAIRAELRRLERSLEEDPSLAIGKAKNLIETTAKIVLDAHGELYQRNTNMGEFIRRAMEVLGVHSSQTRASTAVSDLLKSLQQVALAVNALRNAAGDGHGQASAVTEAGPAESALAARAAIAWCGYMLDTLNKQAAQTERSG